MNTDEVITETLDDAYHEGCTCDPVVQVASAGGLALIVRLEHELGCPLARSTA